jgi:hypothetical protein
MTQNLINIWASPGCVLRIDEFGLSLTLKVLLDVVTFRQILIISSPIWSFIGKANLMY